MQLEIGGGRQTRNRRPTTENWRLKTEDFLTCSGAGSLWSGNSFPCVFWTWSYGKKGSWKIHSITSFFHSGFSCKQKNRTIFYFEKDEKNWAKWCNSLSKSDQKLIADNCSSYLMNKEPLHSALFFLKLITI